MAKKENIGPCHICGKIAKLSFEHVPPQSAFNKRPLVYADIETLLKTPNLEIEKGKIHQKGSGGYTLCERCNNLTGAWYGNAFVDWAYQGMQILHYTRNKPSLYYNFHLFPLRVIKQIVCMFFSSNSSTFRDIHPHLEQFVLNKDKKYLTPEIRLFVFYSIGDRSRSAGVTGLLRGIDTANTQMHTFSEITFPPFGYVMTINTEPPDARLFEITHFANYGYDTWRSLSLQLPILPIYTYFPGDYRSAEEVTQQLK